MIFPRLKEIAKENSWYKSQGGVFGIYKEYFFSLSDGQGFKAVFLRTDNISEETIKRIDEEITGRKKELGFSEKVVAADGIFLKCSESFRSLKKESLYRIMDALVEVCTRYKISGSHCCAECKGKDRLQYYHLNDIGTILCDSCFARLAYEHERKTEEYDTEEKYYLRGTIGAIFLTLAGVAAWVLLAYYTERIYAVLAFAFAWLSLKGYDLFKAKRGKWTPVIIISINIFAILISNITTLLFALMMNGLTWDESWNALLSDNEIRSAIGKDLLMSFVVCAVALFYLGRTMWVSHKPAKFIQAAQVE